MGEDSNITSSKLELTSMKKLYEKRYSALLEAKDSLKEKESLVEKLQKEVISQKKLIEVLQQKNEALNHEINQMKSNLNASFTAKELSQYLSATVQGFNETTINSNNFADYIINSLDIDLKTRVFSEGEQIRFTSPNLSSNSDEAVSSVKVSIRAVPKQ